MIMKSFELITMDEIQRVFRQKDVFFRLLILVKDTFQTNIHVLLPLVRGLENLSNYFYSPLIQSHPEK